MFDSCQLKHFCRNGARQCKLRQGEESFRKHTAETANKGRAPPKSGVKYSYEGKNKDGIEVYETSSEVKALTRKERQKKFLEIMQNEYRGRTAKFVRNGHTYYATFDNKNISKNIYGDKRSSSGGYNAKIKVGADGNVFELVENAKYNGSKKETGKNAKAHKEIQYWDYYVKTVQIDDQVYDLVANVRRKSTGDFVYSIQLRGNNTIEASAAQQPNQKVGVNKAANASKGSIPNTSENVKKYSLEPTEEAKDAVKRAEEYFGTTYKIKEAGYITTDGKMLDFSGRHEGANGGYRTVDHREIGDALGEEYGGEDYSGAMVRFIGEGNIRVSPEMGGINLSVLPNKAQRGTLDRYISNFRGEVILDIDDANGSTIASVEYPKYTHSSVVLKDVDDYFDKGKIPEKFSREPQIRKNANVSKQAWAQIQNQRMLKYGNKFDTMPSMDYIFANDNLFVINNYDETSFSVTRKINPAKDKVLADKIVEAFRNGSVTNTREYNSIAKMLRNNARRSNGDNVHAGNGRAAGDNARLDDKSERAADRGNATYKGRGDNGVSYSREPESITELRRQNETMLAQATNENERGLIKDYKRQYDKVSGIAEKLNTARQEVLTAENGGLKLKVVNLKTDP